ncbi:hypothetical protein RclHR1_00110031 [Rhizophagus clarus]|uniref:Uncharacterized protein n=1 Tax=Rhizophagus clarus TaxID=94130 RepID=A0A2Z6QUN3_9GLOM|nr:hypothetical protein RclHR1_00110031 [Rhizophagus clarus]
MVYTFIIARQRLRFRLDLPYSWNTREHEYTRVAVVESDNYNNTALRYVTTSTKDILNFILLLRYNTTMLVLQTQVKNCISWHFLATFSTFEKGKFPNRQKKSKDYLNQLINIRPDENRMIHSLLSIIRSLDHQWNSSSGPGLIAKISRNGSTIFFRVEALQYGRP